MIMIISIETISMENIFKSVKMLTHENCIATSVRPDQS